MAGERTIKIKFDGDQSGLVKAANGSHAAINKLDNGVRKNTGSLDAHGRAAAKSAAQSDKARAGFAGMGSAAGFAAVGIGIALAAWVGATGRALVEVERLRAQTDTVIKSMGAAWTNTSHITNYAEKLEKLSGIEMEQVQTGQNLLLTYGNIRNEVGEGNNVFDQATSLMLDLSVATGKDMPGAATLLGKALNDPIKGLGALTKVGVGFTEQQKTQITAMVEAGDVMGAQKVILAELTKQFGGSAAAFGETTAGQVLKLQNQFGNLSEELLADLLPALNSVVSAVLDVITWMQQNEDLVKTLALAAAGLAATWLTVHAAIKLVNVATSAWNALAGLARGSTAGLGASFAAMSTAAKVASLSMGAIGLVVTAIGVAMSIWGGQSAEAEARQSDLASAGKRVAEAIAEQNGAIDANVRQLAIKEASEANLLKQARELGISSKLVIDAILGESGARQRLNRELDSQANAAGGTAADVLNLVGVEENAYSTAAQLRDGVNGVTDGMADYQQATQDSTAASGENLTVLQQQVIALEDLLDKQREAAGIILDQRSAERDLIDAIAGADEALEKNKATLDINTQAGRDNQAALDGIVNKTFDVLDSMVANGAGNDALVAKMTIARAEFVRVATAMTGSATEANNLADQLGLIPGTYTATVTANTTPAATAVSQLQTHLNNLVSQPYRVKVTADMPAGGGGLLGSATGGKATGGPVLAGQAYKVGERGPEIFVPPNSGNIVPNHHLGGGGETLVNVFIDGEKFRGTIRSEIREAQRGTRRVATSGTGLGR